MPTHEFTLLSLIWCLFALTCGGLIKGTLGVGTPLLTVPMLTLVMPVQSAVVLMACPIVIANLWQSAQGLNWRATLLRFAPIAITLIVCAYFGSRILAVIDDQILLILIGVVVLIITTQQATQYRLVIPVRWQTIAGVIAGATAGMVGGVSSMFGPVLILYLVSLQDLCKEQFVSAISLLYLCAVVPWAFSLRSADLLSGQLLILSVIATVPVMTGVLAGQRLRGRLDETKFHRAVIAVLYLSGGSLLLQGVID